jgi:hypothetical protein
MLTYDVELSLPRLYEVRFVPSAAACSTILERNETKVTVAPHQLRNKELAFICFNMPQHALI